jgi:hypothetical protein
MGRGFSRIQRIYAGRKEFPLGGFLGVLCVLAVNADLHIYRQVAKDAKKTPSKTTWLQLWCAVCIR